MLEPRLISLFVEPLEEHGIRYLVSGSVATIIYGEPRATMDIDVGVFLSDDSYEIISQLYDASEFYTPPVDVIRLESSRENRGHYNIIHHKSGLKADIYPSKNHPLLEWALKNRVREVIGGLEISLAPPEYVILWKLEFLREGGSQKHRRDIRGVLAVQAGSIDLELIEETSGELGLRDVWDKVLQQN